MRFAQCHASRVLTNEKVVLICGRFEGIDQRVIDYYNLEELSIGDYVLSGGELASMVVIDACVRLLPGVLGNKDSLECESFSAGYLEHDHYTKPLIWNGLSAPGVLLSGNHAKISQWRSNSSSKVTNNLNSDIKK